MNYKKILRIIAIVLIIAAIGVGVYFFWSWLNSKGGVTGIISGGAKPTTEVTSTSTSEVATITTETQIDTTTQESQTVTQKLSILINSPVFEYWLSSKDNSLYFANLDGQIIKINSNNTRQLVSSQLLTDLHSITPSVDGSLAIAKFNYPRLPTLSIFFASSTSWQPLPAGTISASISPDLKKIAYTDQSALKTLDLATQKTTEVQKMSQVGLKISWLKTNELFFYEDPSVENNGRMYSFNLTDKTFKTLIDGEYGLAIKWAKDGHLGIKISSEQRVPKLVLIDEFGSPIANFTFLSVPEKCLIEAQKIYCGVPKNTRSGMVLPDDFYSKKYYFIDDIFELDLPTGAITKLFDGNEIAIDATNLKIKDNSLLFINRYDNKVYSLKLD